MKMMSTLALALALTLPCLAQDQAQAASGTAKALSGTAAAAAPTMKSAKLLLTDGKFAEAAEAYLAMGPSRTKSVETWRCNNLGLALIKQGKFSEAVKPLEDAVAADGKNATAWNNLGVAYENTDQAAKALEAYRKGVEAAKQGNQPSDRVNLNLRKFEIKSGISATAEAKPEAVTATAK